MLKADGNFQVEHVPFRGTSLLVQEMLAGRIPFGADQLSSAMPHIRSGALRAIAIRAPSRSRLLPDVATAREQAFPNAELLGWNGYLAPTPGGNASAAFRDMVPCPGGVAAPGGPRPAAAAGIAAPIRHAVPAVTPGSRSPKTRASRS